MSEEANKDVNVMDQPLQMCGLKPKTGFRRTGACNSGQQDVGRHLLCAVVTREFLDFSRARGNDLISPVPAYQFPGLKPGDHWCLCIDRWLEALEADVAPPVILAATHKAVLQTVDLEVLQRYAAQINA